MVGLPGIARYLPEVLPSARSGSAIEAGLARVRTAREAQAASGNDAALGRRSTWATGDGRLEAPNVPFEYAYGYVDSSGKYNPFGENDLGATTRDGRIVINKELMHHLDDIGVKVADNDKVIPTLRHEYVHRKLAPGAGTASEDLGWWTARNRDLRWRLYSENQFGRYLEEAAAEAYGRGSLLEGLQYPLQGSNAAAYRLTPGGIARDAGKLGLGVLGAGMAAVGTGQALGRVAKSYYGNW